MLFCFVARSVLRPDACASGKARDNVTGQKNVAFGGAYRLVGVVAALARCDGIAPADRAYPSKPICPIRMIQNNPDML